MTTTHPAKVQRRQGTFSRGKMHVLVKQDDEWEHSFGRGIVFRRGANPILFDGSWASWFVIALNLVFADIT